MKKLLIIVLLVVGCEEPLEPEDCAGVAGGTAELDKCDVCDDDPTNDCVQDCAGLWGGDGSVCDTVTDIDGNIYQTVQIGDQLWMSENLKTTHYNDGSEIQYVQSESSELDVWENLSTGAYGYYNDDPSHLETYGNLYNWYAVDEGDLCMEGWHVPSNDEWTVLTDYLGGSGVAGGKMKEEGLDHWNSPNTGATNESGFTGLPAGYRSTSNGPYYTTGNYGYFWSSSGDNSTNAWYRKLNYSSSDVYRNYAANKRNGFSIRCLRD